MRLLIVTVAALTLSITALVSAADAQVAIVATPAKTIDGADSDWAVPTAAIMIGDDPGDGAIGKVAYDREYFYAVMTVRDSSPRKNSATVIPELLKGGDAVGFVFGAQGGTPAQRILIAEVRGKPVVLAMRPTWSGEAKPHAYHTLAAGTERMAWVAPLSEAKAAFAATPDGYRVELAIPWATLGLTPSDGATLPFDAQVIWSDPAGTINTRTKWWHSTGTGPTSTMDIVTEARFYPDAWGTARFTAIDPGPIARSSTGVVTGGQQVTIPFTLNKPATVSLVIVRDDGWIIAEPVRAQRFAAGSHTASWNGRDRSGLPLPSGIYRWRMGAFDGMTATFHGSVGNSGRPVFRSEDGNGSIGGSHGGPTAVGADADGVYLLHSGEEGQRCIRKIDPTTGRARWWASTGVFGQGYAAAADGGSVYFMISPHDGDARLVRFDTANGHPQRIADQDGIGLGKLRPSGLAVADGHAVFSDRVGNRLGVIDLTKGSVTWIEKVPAPSALCVAKGRILVCSGDQVLSVDAPARTVTPIISKLAQPCAITADRAGELFIFEQGSRQILRCDAAGKIRARIGKAGGGSEAQVVYDPLAFHTITGMAIGPDDHIWLVEPGTPRRHVRLTKDGVWKEDFYGSTGFATVGVDLDDPTSLTYQVSQGEPTYVRASYDPAAYAKRPGDPIGTWKVESLVLLTQNGIDRSATPDLMQPTINAGYGRMVIFTATNKQRYLFKPHDGFALFRWDQGRWVSAAAVCRRRIGEREVWQQWSDRDGDGLSDADEIVEGAIPTGSTSWIDRDLTIHGMWGAWKPQSIDARGVPTYGAFTPVFARDAKPLDVLFEQENYGISAAQPAADGARYYCSNVGPEQGADFWDRASETRLARVVDGRVQWVIGHHDGRLARDGDNVMLMNLAGEVDGVLIAAEVASGFTAYTSDGLTLGWVGGRPEIGPLAWYVENVQPGSFIKDPTSGKRLLIGSTTEDVRVLAIDGVFGDQIRRTTGEVTLPAAPGDDGFVDIASRSWSHIHGSRYCGVDAYDWEWARDVAPLRVFDGGKLLAEVRLRRDAGRLCVFADVLDAGAATLPNGEPLSSPAIEIDLGPLGERAAAGPGDTRIVLLPRRDGVALVCRPASPPLTAISELRPLGNNGDCDGAAPSAPLDLRTLTAIPGAKVVARPRLDGLGYRLEAEIPLALLPELTTSTAVRIRRQNGIDRSDTRSDLTQPLRLNVAVWQAASGGVRRIAWRDDGLTKPDATAMRPSSWGHANSRVTLRWPSETWATKGFMIYRATVDDPTQATPLEAVVSRTTTRDGAPPAGARYWIAGIDAAGEGQWAGPVIAHEGVADFAAAVFAPAHAAAAVPAVEVFPGSTATLSLVVRGQVQVTCSDTSIQTQALVRKAGNVAITIAAGRGSRPGTNAEITVRVGGKEWTTLKVAVTPVPIRDGRVEVSVLRRTDGRVLDVQPDKQPVTHLGWSGIGALPQRDLGKGGFALMHCDGKRALVQVRPPFADTFAGGGDGFDGSPLSYSPIKVFLAGRELRAESWKVPSQGATGSLTLRADDDQAHVATIVCGSRFENGPPPSEWHVTDPATKKSWPLTAITAKDGVVVIQFRFIGTVVVSVQQTGKGPVDTYDSASIAAVFLD